MQTGILCYLGWFFFKYIYQKNNFCTKIAALKLLHSLQNVENQFGPGVWPYVKRMVNKQKGKNKAKTLNTCLREGACSTTRIGIVMKICFADSTCNAFWKYNFPELLIGFPRLHQTPHGTVESEAPCNCVYKTRAHIRFQKVVDTFQQSVFLRQFTIIWQIPQSSNLPISCFKT